jgi:2-C-methyl-D-erythritol 4-phosphate cytidylyltransferase
MLHNDYVDNITVVVKDSERVEVQHLLTELRPEMPIQLASGGSTRQQSVANGLAKLPPDYRLVAITDAVRPFTPPGMVDMLVSQFRDLGDHYAGIVPTTLVFETARRVSPNGISLGTVERESLRLMQTPQLFCRICFEESHTKARAVGVHTTDDAGILEHSGLPVATCPGDPNNFKITITNDLLIAEALVASGSLDDKR